MAVRRETIQKRVEAGAAFLDERLPGWRKFVDPTLLAMQDGDRCILGQLFPEPLGLHASSERSGYGRACGMFGLTLREEAKLGFDVPPRLVNDWGYYLDLTDLWLEELRK